MELKQGRIGENALTFIPFNQTRMELKRVPSPARRHSAASFNQTRMELKRISSQHPDAHFIPFNQTRMELKHG